MSELQLSAEPGPIGFDPARTALVIIDDAFVLRLQRRLTGEGRCLLER